MDFESYTQISQYLRADSTGKDDTIRPLSQNQRKVFRLKAKKFSIVDHTLCRDGKIVLHEANVTPVLRNLHKTALEHSGNYLELYREAQTTYFIEGKPPIQVQGCLLSVYQMYRSQDDLIRRGPYAAPNGQDQRTNMPDDYDTGI